MSNNKEENKLSPVFDNYVEGTVKESTDELLEKIMLESMMERDKKVPLGVYVNSRTAKALDLYARKTGYGSKTNLVNDLLEIYLEKFGYFEKLDQLTAQKREKEEQ